MKETGHPTLQELSFTPYHHHFGPSPLETLPEEEGDDDTGEECENFRSESTSPLTPDYLWPPPSVDDLGEGDLKISCPTIRHEIERQRAKVQLLESTIGQLQEELRESKDQNELLEFRLLELGDLEASSTKQISRVVDVPRCSGRKSVDSAEDSAEEGVEGLGSPTSQGPSLLYEAEATSSSPEVTHNEERCSNGHASVTEARSSCSDCSESLSFQESGIFESQFSEDSYTTSLRQCSVRGTSQEDLSSELSRLVSQLEELVTRVQQSDEPRNEGGCGGGSKGKVKGVNHSTDPNLPYEFLICRQRIEEFERKLRKHGNVDYVQSLENKISLLLSESQKLEEEKAEMEEAENDSRNLCQRYEEKLKRTKQKKRNLELELCEASDYVQQLRNEIQILEVKEERLSNQLSCLETKIQNSEQQNFELEESNMELKDSIQFLLQSIPALIAWVVFKSQQRRPPLHRPSRPRLTWLQNRCATSSLGVNDSSATLPEVNYPSTTLLPQVKYPSATLPEVNCPSTTLLPQVNYPSTTLLPQVNYPSTTLSHANYPSTTLPDANYPSTTLLPQVNYPSTTLLHTTYPSTTVPDANYPSTTLPQANYPSTTLLQVNDLSSPAHQSCIKVNIGIQTCSELLEKAQKQKSFCRNVSCSAESQSASSFRTLNPFRSKYSSLEEDWEALIKALDEFEVERSGPGKNSNESVAIGGMRPLASVTGTSKLKGTLVANRIRSLFPTEMTPKIQQDFEECWNTSKIFRMTNQLTQKVREHYQNRNGVPRSGTGGTNTGTVIPPVVPNLLQESLESRNQEIVHLTTEVTRLKNLVHEEEKSSLIRIETLESENLQLREALTTAIDLRNKLDDSRAYTERLINRVEELEQNEMNWKEKLKIQERKDRKNLDRICGLKSEMEFMTGRLAVVQAELEIKIETEIKKKQEIQILQSQLKDALSIIQDKEDFLNRTESHFQEKISQLGFELAGSQRELSEMECSNGMLREEVLYFEKTLAEVTERVAESEKLVQILNCKVDELQKRNAELKKQVAEGGNCGESDLLQSNDLEAFAKKEGGLKGVCWHVKDAMATVETCLLCKSTVGPKLREVSEQLTTLTTMLEGSQAEGHLSRCESEEHLSPTLMASNLSKWNSGPNGSMVYPWRCHVEENKALKLSIAHLEAELFKKEEAVRKLSEKQRIQSSQLKGLDDLRIRREKDIRESHLNESWLWKLRCDEKNEIIQILAKTIPHLFTIHFNPTDHIVEYILDQIVKDIQKVAKSYPVMGNSASGGDSPLTTIEDFPLDTTSLLTYFESERSRIREIAESCPSPPDACSDGSSGHVLDFRVVRRIGDDALLVSWCANPAIECYEISVNGESFVRVPRETRQRAFLHGLDMGEPLQLTLRAEAVEGQGHHETSITYFA